MRTLIFDSLPQPVCCKDAYSILTTGLRNLFIFKVLAEDEDVISTLLIQTALLPYLMSQECM